MNQFTTGNSYISPPRLNIPDSEKNEDWHRQMALWVLGRSWMYGTSPMQIRRLYDYYSGTQSMMELMNQVWQSDDGSTMPAAMKNFNVIQPRINTLIGELASKGLRYTLDAVNEEAVSAKLAEKEMAFVRNSLIPFYQEISDILGEDMMPTLPNGQPFPESGGREALEEIEEYFELDYRSLACTLMDRILKYELDRNNWTTIMKDVWADILICGRGIIKTEMRSGRPYVRRVDPVTFIFDPGIRDDFGLDAQYCGELSYKPYNEVVTRYNLTDEQIERISQLMSTPGAQAVMSPISSGGVQYPLWRYQDNSLQVLVLEAEWVDTKVLKYASKRSSSGKKIANSFRQVPSSQKEFDESRRIKIIRRATLILNDILVDWGEQKNMNRSSDDFADTNFSYTFFMSGYSKVRATQSFVNMMVPFQDRVNIFAWKIEQAVAKSQGSVFAFDIAQIPGGFSVDEILKYVRQSGIMLLNSKSDGAPANYNAIQSMSLSNAEEISTMMTVIEAYQAQIDSMIGMARERMGTLTAATQAFANTQAAMDQSAMSILSLHVDYAETMIPTVFEKMIGIIKIGVRHKPQIYKKAVGDLAVQFAIQDHDMDMQDYGVFVKKYSAYATDKALISQMVMASLQQGSIHPAEALEILGKDDPKEAIRDFKAWQARQERKAREEQEMQIQAQKEMQARQLQAQLLGQQQQLQAQQQMQDDKIAHEMLRSGIDRHLESQKMRDEAINSLLRGQ